MFYALFLTSGSIESGKTAHWGPLCLSSPHPHTSCSHHCPCDKGSGPLGFLAHSACQSLPKENQESGIPEQTTVPSTLRSWGASCSETTSPCILWSNSPPHSLSADVGKQGLMAKWQAPGPAEDFRLQEWDPACELRAFLKKKLLLINLLRYNWQLHIFKVYNLINLNHFTFLPLAYESSNSSTSIPIHGMFLPLNRYVEALRCSLNLPFCND